MCLKSGEESILKGNDDLKKLFLEKSLNRDAIRQAQILIDMRVELAHIPWRVESDAVWETVTESVPALHLEVRRAIAERPE